MTLHTVNRSPLSGNTLDECLRTLSPPCALLLIEDGVYGAAPQWQQRFATLPAGVELFVLQPDLAARGLSSNCNAAFTAVDDAGFVDLTIRYTNMVAWY